MNPKVKWLTLPHRDLQLQVLPESDPRVSHVPSMPWLFPTQSTLVSASQRHSEIIRQPNTLQPGKLSPAIPIWHVNISNFSHFFQCLGLL